MVVQKVQELRLEVKHIPGGCTSLCQPIDVDVGFNKTFKDRMQRQWTSWMKGIVHGTTTLPTRLHVAKWVESAMGEMKE